MSNEFYTDGVQIITTTDGIGTITSSTQLGSSSYTTGALTSTWSDTHQTVVNTRALRTGGANPNILTVDNTLFVLDDLTTPTCGINIQADNTGNVGTNFGITLTNTTNNNDFEIRNDPSYDGSIVFKEFGVGSSTKKTAIKQGTITLTDSATPNITSVLNSDGLIVANSTTGKSTIVYEGGVQLQSPTSIGDFQSSLFTLTDTSIPNNSFINELTTVSQLYQATDLSLGTGQNLTINTTFGSGANITFNSTYDNQPMTISTDQANLVINAGDSSGSGLGNLVLEATDDLFINGANLEQLAAGSSSGVFLRFRLNGTYYKIALLNDV